MPDAVNHPIAKAIDALAVGSIIGAIVGWLPTISIVLSCIWFAIQIYESKTFKNFCRFLRTRFRRSGG